MKSRKIRKLLVANRGEIAVRVIKSAKEMGIKTVAVHSDIDAAMPFVRLADEAYAIGPAPAKESYLRMDKIVDAAKRSGADAIHPGYGFLSENDEFAELLLKEGIIFVGPSPESMREMGDKTAARRLAAKLGIPMTEGVIEPVNTIHGAHAIAKRIGYQILIKAAAGGGGKGMRIVRADSELESAYELAKSESKSAFGDDRVYFEKYLDGARHVEVQVLADRHGNAVHLGERECSIQRRHQKLVEESPSVIVDETLRKALTEAALILVRESKYENAGTIEFLVDGDKNFYFLEMNTRLQVEHPVTEMRTGLDLVKEQIRIAEGNKLPFKQADIEFRGAAIECRVNAEDSANDFFPSTGTIAHIGSTLGVHTREDRGMEPGSEVTPYYDSLISKIICWGKTREESLERMSRTLSDYVIYGVRTNLDLLSWIVSHPKFRSGEFSTKFLGDHFTTAKLSQPNDDDRLLATIVCLQEETSRKATKTTGQNGAPKSKWAAMRFEDR